MPAALSLARPPDWDVNSQACSPPMASTSSWCRASVALPS